jgi:hypothetical protein
MNRDAELKAILIGENSLCFRVHYKTINSKKGKVTWLISKNV